MLHICPYIVKVEVLSIVLTTYDFISFAVCLQVSREYTDLLRLKKKARGRTSLFYLHLSLYDINLLLLLLLLFKNISSSFVSLQLNRLAYFMAHKTQDSGAGLFQAHVLSNTAL